MQWRCWPTRQWFECNQQRLLRLLNRPIIGRFVKRLLGIPGLPVVRISDSFWICSLGNGQLQMTVFPGPVVSRRIARHFGFLLGLTHCWDASFAKLTPALNLGCDTLVVYPDPDPEVTSVDGYMERTSSGESWTFIRHGAGTNANDYTTSLGLYLLASPIINYPWMWLRRSAILFDTSALGEGATISAATISLYCTNATSGLGDTTADIVSVVTASNTQLSASGYYYGNFGTQTFAQKSLSAHNVNQYNDFPLNSYGIANISRTGVSKFGLRFGWDTLNSPPPWQSGSPGAMISYSSADESGTSQDPKLTITYTPGVTEKYVYDSGALTSTETVINDAYAPVGDGGALRSSEAVDVAVFVFSSDGGALRSTETVDLVITDVKAVADGGAIRSTESISVQEVVQITVSDSGSIRGSVGVDLAEFTLPPGSTMRTGIAYKKK